MGNSPAASAASMLRRSSRPLNNNPGVDTGAGVYEYNSSQNSNRSTSSTFDKSPAPRSASQGTNHGLNTKRSMVKRSSFKKKMLRNPHFSKSVDDVRLARIRSGETEETLPLRQYSKWTSADSLPPFLDNSDHSGDKFGQFGSLDNYRQLSMQSGSVDTCRQLSVQSGSVDHFRQLGMQSGSVDTYRQLSSWTKIDVDESSRGMDSPFGAAATAYILRTRTVNTGDSSNHGRREGEQRGIQLRCRQHTL
jgi:hypothetical protein